MRHKLLFTLGLMVLGMVAFTALPAGAVTGTGPYYAMPSWNQTLAGEQGKVSSSLNKSDMRSLPQALQAAFSAAAGHDDPAYAIGKTAEGYHGSNTRHNLSMDFSSGGIKIRSGTSQWGLRLTKIGYGNELHAVASTVPKVTANRVEYLYGGITEWYENGPLGLEQGFTIDHAPADQRNGGLLTLELSSSGDLSPTIDGAGTELLLTGRGGTRILWMIQKRNIL